MQSDEGGIVWALEERSVWRERKDPVQMGGDKRCGRQVERSVVRSGSGSGSGMI